MCTGTDSIYLRTQLSPVRTWLQNRHRQDLVLGTIISAMHASNWDQRVGASPAPRIGKGWRGKEPGIRVTNKGQDGAQGMELSPHVSLPLWTYLPAGGTENSVSHPLPPQQTTMHSTKLARWLSAALVALATTGVVAASPSGPGCSPGRTKQFLTVKTTNGPITGHAAPETSSTCVIEYLGIPFAKPPLGDLRFAAPQPIDTESAFTAANFGFDCPLSPSKAVAYPGFTPQAQRIINYFASGAGMPQSEDCLTLNIWSKATPKAVATKKPVIVFFYGGRECPTSSNLVLG